MPSTVKDYLAICLIGAGSSFGRASTIDQAVDNCKRSLERDWSSLFNLDGQEAKINVFDVTGHDQVWWDDRGLHSEADPNVKFERAELRTVKLSVKRRRR